MTEHPALDMMEVTRLTREGRLDEAMGLLQTAFANAAAGNFAIDAEGAGAKGILHREMFRKLRDKIGSLCRPRGGRATPDAADGGTGAAFGEGSFANPAGSRT